jgi:hypothetical protein
VIAVGDQSEDVIRPWSGAVGGACGSTLTKQLPFHLVGGLVAGSVFRLAERIS